MELRQLVSFYHVAQLRSVSKAARTLELGQPTVTTHLRKLEEEFGITVFDRIKRPIQLTSEGATLLELVTPVVQAVDTLKTQMDYAEQRGSFVIGGYPDLVQHHLPQGIQAFRANYPDVKLQLIARPYAQLLRLVKSGEVDIAFTAPPPTDDMNLEFRKLFEYDIVLMTPPDHPLLEKRDVQLRDIAAWPLILTGPESWSRQRIEEELRAEGMPVDVVLALDDTESIKRYVEIGLGVAVCVDFTLHREDEGHIGVVPLDHIFPSSCIGICTLKGKFLGQAVQNFMEVMTAEMRGYQTEFSDWEPATAKGTKSTVGSGR